MDEAKTIDLCNNPLTKVPKIEIAKKRVAEWPGLEQEVLAYPVDRRAYKRGLLKDNRV